jgi:uncharacterized protein
MNTLFNDFFAWNLNNAHDRFDHPPLSEDELTELFDLYGKAGLPEAAMSNMEIVDGYLAACIVGPELPATHEWLEIIFGQPHLPICADAQMQERLLTLIRRRFMDISDALSIARSAVTVDNMYTPLVGDIDPATRIHPYQLDAGGQRVGNWEFKDWAAGFKLAIITQPLWETLVASRAYSLMLAPLVIAGEGYNPDQRDLQYDDAHTLKALLLTMPYDLRDFWRGHDRRITMPSPYQRSLAKIGRNDPCVCGSGKKYKKCCAA